MTETSYHSPGDYLGPGSDRWKAAKNLCFADMLSEHMSVLCLCSGYDPLWRACRLVERKLRGKCWSGDPIRGIHREVCSLLALKRSVGSSRDASVEPAIVVWAQVQRFGDLHKSAAAILKHLPEFRLLSSRDLYLTQALKPSILIIQNFLNFPVEQFSAIFRRTFDPYYSPKREESDERIYIFSAKNQKKILQASTQDPLTHVLGLDKILAEQEDCDFPVTAEAKALLKRMREGHSELVQRFRP